MVVGFGLRTFEIAACAEAVPIHPAYQTCVRLQALFQLRHSGPIFLFFAPGVRNKDVRTLEQSKPGSAEHNPSKH